MLRSHFWQTSMIDPSFSMVDMHGRQVLCSQSGQSWMPADGFEARQTWQVFELPGVLGIGAVPPPCSILERGVFMELLFLVVVSALAAYWYLTDNTSWRA